MNNLDIILKVTEVDTEGLQGREPHPTPAMVGEEVRVLEMRRFDPIKGEYDLNGEVQMFKCLRRPGLAPSILVFAEHEVEPVAVGDCAKEPVRLDEQAVSEAFYRLTVQQRENAWREVETLMRRANQLLERNEELEREKKQLVGAAQLAQKSQERFIVYLKALCRQAYERLKTLEGWTGNLRSESLEFQLEVASRVLQHDGQYTDPRIAELEAKLADAYRRASTGRW